ncbi:MAG: DUF4145 domain-containing protein [Hyphomicrobiales bacterium]|nr:DUF4145 domain-containing protein [Hyphomicrobiales bacterium]
MSKSPKLGDTTALLKNILGTLPELYLSAEIGRALSACAMMDNVLSWGIKQKMVSLSTEVEDRIFGGVGPLSNFSSKIDIAFSLSIIDAQMRNQLHIVRKIRNEFAHATKQVNFQTDKILELCKKLALSSEISDPENAFVTTITRTMKHITQSMTSTQQTLLGISPLESLRLKTSPGQTDKEG